MMFFFLFHIKVHKLAGGVLIRKKKKLLHTHRHITLSYKVMNCPEGLSLKGDAAD